MNIQNYSLSFDKFIKIVPSKNGYYYKCLNNELNHYGYKYKLGLNEDHNDFNPYGSGLRGGLYFTIYDDLIKFTKHGINIAKIKLCEDAQFYIDPENPIYSNNMLNPNKYKTNKFIIEEIYQDYDFLKMALQNNGLLLKDVKKIDKELCKIALENDGLALQYVLEQDEELCKIAVKQYGLALEYVKDNFKTDEICKIAIDNNYYAFEFVINQTDEICKFTLFKNGLMLKYIKVQNKELCTIALKNNGYALRYVIKQDNELCKIALQNNGMALRFVNNKTYDLCTLAMEQNIDALIYVS